jgi:WhiB family redox-sensing transcriptional regulator
MTTFLELDTFLDATGWKAAALCAQTDPEEFFPEKGESTKHAKAICRRCTVRAECLDAALATDERYGIWGGLSERERRRLKRTHAGELTLTPTKPGAAA